MLLEKDISKLRNEVEVNYFVMLLKGWYKVFQKFIVYV